MKWIVEKMPVSDGYNIKDETGATLFQSWGGSKKYAKQQKTNSILAAAAPALLEACRKVELALETDAGFWEMLKTVKYAISLVEKNKG